MEKQLFMPLVAVFVEFFGRHRYIWDIFTHRVQYCVSLGILVTFLEQHLTGFYRSSWERRNYGFRYRVKTYPSLH